MPVFLVDWSWGAGYVLLSGPEQFMWDVRDFMVPICTPYEMEVALGAREWTGDYITDLEVTGLRFRS